MWTFSPAESLRNLSQIRTFPAGGRWNQIKDVLIRMWLELHTAFLSECGRQLQL